MSSHQPELSIAALEEIESVCQEFEDVCQQDLAAANEAVFLNRMSDDKAKSQLLVELILLKADYQLRAGQWPDRAH